MIMNYELAYRDHNISLPKFKIEKSTMNVSMFQSSLTLPSSISESIENFDMSSVGK